MATFSNADIYNFAIDMACDILRDEYGIEAQILPQNINMIGDATTEGNLKIGTLIRMNNGEHQVVKFISNKDMMEYMLDKDKDNEARDIARRLDFLKNSDPERYEKFIVN